MQARGSAGTVRPARWEPNARPNPTVSGNHRRRRLKKQWLRQQRQRVPDGSAAARAIDHSLKRWAALTRYLDDGDLPIDNNGVENRIRPVAPGRQDWLFAGSLRAGKRAAAAMSRIHSAKLVGLEPHAYLRDVLERLPTQPAGTVAEPLPQRWHTFV